MIGLSMHKMKRLHENLIQKAKGEKNVQSTIGLNWHL